jgi:DUF971 family protein
MKIGSTKKTIGNIIAKGKRKLARTFTDEGASKTAYAKAIRSKNASPSSIYNATTEGQKKAQRNRRIAAGVGVAGVAGAGAYAVKKRNDKKKQQTGRR